MLCSGPSTTTETETVAKYEIMDGAPVKGESIPIRLFLAGNSSSQFSISQGVSVLWPSAGYDLTPTMRDVNKKFSVRYFLNLVLVDEEDRRYFKQQVICRRLKSWRPSESHAPFVVLFFCLPIFRRLFCGEKLQRS